MKRQRNIQQVNEHDKCPANQTKKEEKGSLPEKEFRIMIVQMIQNLEKKNGFTDKTRIEKIQEMFNKDLGEGNGTPLQYSWLENPMDRGAW